MWKPRLAFPKVDRLCRDPRAETPIPLRAGRLAGRWRPQTMLTPSLTLRKASPGRRSTVSSKTLDRNGMTRSSVVESRQGIAKSSSYAGLRESFAQKQAAAPTRTTVRHRSPTQPKETQASSSITNVSSGNSTSSAKDYCNLDEDPLSKLQDGVNTQGTRVNSSVNGGHKLTPRSPLMQLMALSEKFPAAEGRLRMLVSVTLLGTIWEVRVIVNAQETVKDVIRAALAAYSREGRKLSGGGSDHSPEDYELYLSQFSLQYLDMDARMMDVGARSFVLRQKREVPNVVEAKRWWRFQ